MGTLTDTSIALAQMAARFGSGDNALARLVREHQDLGNEWRFRDQRLVDNLSRSTAERNHAEERALRARLEAIEARLETVGEELQRRFPSYAELSNPKPLSLAQTQNMLKSDEALLQAAFGVDEGYAWLVTKSDVRWLAIPIGKTALADHVTALRCGLDTSNWDLPAGWPEDTPAERRRIGEQLARRERCRQLLRIEVSSGEPPPFDFRRAHELYQKILEPFEDLIRGKKLIVVPAGPLAALPLHVLLTRAPDYALQGYARFQQAKWLALESPISVLPSVGSLSALRKLPRSKASYPYIGFGNPLLEGRRAGEALAKQACKETVVSRRQRSAGIALPNPPRQIRGVVGDLSTLRSQDALPETADEMCRVARALGAVGREAETVWLGERATETNLKALNASRALARYSVLHFATHGLLSSESEMLLKAKGEPALVMTPPKGNPAEADLELDNGLLSASEVAQLELDADWVVLSACNTAGGERDDAEALSGLARAFFYAKARALLVSHWYVNSDAAVKLIVQTFNELKAKSGEGRSQALMHSMRVLITKGKPHEAHPAIWAPFVIVGEGRR
jgi:CHAT domain-containing protein